jgi:hypothetical protein
VVILKTELTILISLNRTIGLLLILRDTENSWKLIISHKGAIEIMQATLNLADKRLLEEIPDRAMEKAIEAT